MPEPTNINKTPFHRREKKLLDDLYYLLDSASTESERTAINECTSIIIKYLGIDKRWNSVK